MNLLNQFKNRRIYSVHDSDLDGVSSYIIALLYIKPVSYQFTYTITSKRDMSEFDELYARDSEIIIFSDITPTIKLYQHLTQDLGKEVFIFDHHIGVRGELLTVADKNYYFSNEMCGAKVLLTNITLGNRIKKCVYEYIEKVDIYDRWVTNSALWRESKDLHNIMYGSVNWFVEESDNTKYSRFIENQLSKFSENKYFYFTEYEKSIAVKAEKKERDNQTQAEKNIQFRVDNSGNKYAYFECSSKLSLVANNLLRKYLNVDYIIGHSTYLETAKKEYNGKISLRCGEHFDVTVIAKLWGGSGHKQASGVDLKLCDFENLRKGEIHLI